jgi:hypothetical protein
MIAMIILAAIGENYAKQSLDGGGVIIISVYIKMDGWMDGWMDSRWQSSKCEKERHAICFSPIVGSID